MAARTFLLVTVAGLSFAWMPPSCDRHGGGRAPAVQQTAGLTEHRVQVAGTSRSYWLFVPPRLPRGARVPVLLAFHGGGSTPLMMMRASRLNHAAGREGFVVVYPEGVGRTWNAGNCCGAAMRRGVDDVGFVRALLADLALRVTVDERRVFATGFSNGGGLAYRLACELSDRIAGIVPVGTSMEVARCTPSRPVPVLHLHGLADEWAPFAGGRSRRAPGTGVHASVPETVGRWTRANGCTAVPRETLGQGGARCVVYSGCRQGADVELCTVEGLGHQWPGGQAVVPEVYGRNVEGFTADSALAAFIRRHSIPAGP